jgi:hypothetical protein
MCRFYSLLTASLLVCTLYSQIDSSQAAGLRGTTNRLAQIYSTTNNASPRIALQKTNTQSGHTEATSSGQGSVTGNGDQWNTAPVYSKYSVGDASNVQVDNRQLGDTVVSEAVVSAFY